MNGVPNYLSDINFNDNNGYITIDTSHIDNRTNQNNQATMTDEEYQNSQRIGAENMDKYGILYKGLYSAYEMGKALDDKVKSVIGTVGEGVATVIGAGEKALEMGKKIATAALIAGVVVTGYYGLKIMAETKKNLRTVRSKK